MFLNPSPHRNYVWVDIQRNFVWVENISERIHSTTERFHIILTTTKVLLNKNFQIFDNTSFTSLISHSIIIKKLARYLLTNTVPNIFCYKLFYSFGITFKLWKKFLPFSVDKSTPSNTSHTYLV